MGEREKQGLRGSERDWNVIGRQKKGSERSERERGSERE